jgi:hypothetical protein
MSGTGVIGQGRGRWTNWIGGGVLLTWCLAAAVSALLTAARQPRDPMPELEASFAPFVIELPASGVVGYLEAPVGGAEAERAYYAAQYALVPRVIVARTGPEFLIVARGTAREGGDPRLEGYFPIRHLPNGHRLFWRLAP